MFLNIILTILVIILILIFTSIYIWWRKFGVEMFKMFEQMKTITNNNPKGNQKSTAPDFKKQMESFNKQMESFNEVFKAFDKLGKNK